MQSSTIRIGILIGVILLTSFLAYGGGDAPGDERGTRQTGGPLPVIGQAISAPDTQVYISPFEVLVTAERMEIPLREIPAATSVVRDEALTAMPRGFAMDEVMMLVPGVKVDNQANGGRLHLSMRGQGILTETGIRSIKVLLDGIPINDPSGFAPDLFDIDFNTVDRMEVLRGPAASLYGGGAAGGIINVLTQNSPKTPLFGNLSTVGGSNSFWKGFGQFGGDVGDVNYRTSFSRTGGDGYRVHTHFWENNVYAKATYTPNSSIQLTPILSWNNTYHENPEGLSLAQYLKDPTLPNDDAIPYNEHTEMNRTTNGITGLIRLQDNHEIRFNGYVKHSNYTEANNHVFDHKTFTTPGTSLQYTYSSGSPGDFIKNKLSLGTDLQWQTIDEHTDSNDHSFEMDSLWSKQREWQRGVGIFLIDRINIGDHWNFMGSLRLDKIYNELTDLLNTDSNNVSGNADFSNVTGRLGVTYSATRDLTLYGSWGQGFIPPSTEELGTNPNGYGGFNTSLVAATSSSFEAGARGTLNQNLAGDLTAFYMTTSNDFDRYRVPGRGNGEQGTFFKNIGATRRFGMELSGEYQPVRPFTIQLAYTYSHFQYDIGEPIPILMEDTSIHKSIENENWLPNSPQHQLTVDVKYDIAPELTLGLETLTLSEAFIDGANIETESVSGYTLLSGRISYRWHTSGLAGELTLQARNLTDRTYVAFSEPDAGGNAYQPGAGREFFAGIRVGF